MYYDRYLQGIKYELTIKPVFRELGIKGRGKSLITLVLKQKDIVKVVIEELVYAHWGEG